MERSARRVKINALSQVVDFPAAPRAPPTGNVVRVDREDGERMAVPAAKKLAKIKNLLLYP